MWADLPNPDAVELNAPYMNHANFTFTLPAPSQKSEWESIYQIEHNPKTALHLCISTYYHDPSYGG